MVWCESISYLEHSPEPQRKDGGVDTEQHVIQEVEEVHHMVDCPRHKDLVTLLKDHPQDPKAHHDLRGSGHAGSQREVRSKEG